MPFKDILVHVDNTHHGAARLDAAIGLAAAHDAHLIGLHVLYFPELPPYIRLQIDEEVMRRQRELALDAARDLEAQFNERVAQAGIRAEWRCVEGQILPAISLHARYADIAIVSQRDPTGEEGPDDAAMPDQLLLSVGRPVMVVPFVGSFPTIGSTVLVAWDASRLATRAVNDALPVLAQAKKVFVVAVNPGEDGEERHGIIPSADICLHLARHGVNAEAQHVFAEDLGVGEMLLSRAFDQGCNMIVCGAYGHTRWRELVLGGVTRHMLRHMTMPVLLSH